jgi:hypothetical protein
MFIKKFTFLFSNLFDIRINESEINEIIKNIDINKININDRKEKVIVNDNIKEKIKNIKPLELYKEK